jgi:hypothetical protein
MYIKWTQNIPDGHTYNYPKDMKYTKIFHSKALRYAKFVFTVWQPWCSTTSDYMARIGASWAQTLGRIRSLKIVM